MLFKHENSPALFFSATYILVLSPNWHYKTPPATTDRQTTLKREVMTMNFRWMLLGYLLLFLGGLRAMQLCSVPLNVNSNLQSLRTALDKSNYTARALKNSRKLLALYLAGQQNCEYSQRAFLVLWSFFGRTSPPQLTRTKGTIRERSENKLGMNRAINIAISN